MSKEKQIESLIHEIRLGVMKGGIGWRTVQIAEQLYDAGYRKQSGWISAENPPDDYRDDYGELIPFLVCCQGTVYPFRAMYDGTNWGDGIGVLKVTHWMPLPEPPQMKGGE